MSVKVHSGGCSMCQSRHPQVLDHPLISSWGQARAKQQERCLADSAPQHNPAPGTCRLAIWQPWGPGRSWGAPQLPGAPLCPSMRQHRLVQIAEHSLVAHGATRQPCNRNQSVRTALHQAARLGREALQRDRDRKQQHQSPL